MVKWSRISESEQGQKHVHAEGCQQSEKGTCMALNRYRCKCVNAYICEYLCLCVYVYTYNTIQYNMYIQYCLIHSTETAWELSTPIAISTASVHILSFKYHYSIKIARTPWRNG